ncbi:MAG: hypothetical protein EXR21_01595 [Flavobacteriaceae bacterium]|nr:hypothetical protein [Flavobacteriaceae bacterium]
MKCIFLFLSCIVALLSFSQTTQKVRANRALSIDIAYSVQQPAGDVGKRFGYNNSIGGGFKYKTERNLVLGISGNFMFGSHSKERTILEAISTKDGDIINSNGQLIQPRLFERGANYFVQCGKLLPLYKNDKNSGLLLMGGIGWLQHKQRIEVPGEGANQLFPEYKRGYDNLHGGIALNQTIAWQFMEPKKQMLNFYIGLEMMHGYTKNLRGYNYATRLPDTSRKYDYFFGLKLCWMIPRFFGFKDKNEEYFYN